MSEKEIDLNTGNFVDPENNTAQDSQEKLIEIGGSTKSVSSMFQEMNMDDILQTIAASPKESLIPWEEAELPSLGRFYQGWENGVVKIRAMTQSVEKIFANRRLVQSGQAIDKLFLECVEFPVETDPASLLVGDRTFLFYYIRGITFGNEYKFSSKCPHCGAENIHTYDMNELINTITVPDHSLGNEPFKVVLPTLSEMTGKEMYVDLRFLRHFDIADATKVSRFKGNTRSSKARAAKNKRKGGQKQQFQNDRSSDILDMSLIKSIVSICGNRDPMIIESIIPKIQSSDVSIIREFLAENSPGIDSSIITECKSCEQEAKSGLPISDTFFQRSK